MTGNLGSVEIGGDLLATAEHKAVFRSLPVEGGIAYPCGACISYNEETKKFKPSTFDGDRIFVVARERKAAETDSAVLCMVHGTVNRNMLRKGVYSEGAFNSWEVLTDQDFITLLENSNIM